MGMGLNLNVLCTNPAPICLSHGAKRGWEDTENILSEEDVGDSVLNSVRHVRTFRIVHIRSV
jgi:hypothetical protein